MFGSKESCGLAASISLINQQCTMLIDYRVTQRMIIWDGIQDITLACPYF